MSKATSVNKIIELSSQSLGLHIPKTNLLLVATNGYQLIVGAYSKSFWGEVVPNRSQRREFFAVLLVINPDSSTSKSHILIDSGSGMKVVAADSVIKVLPSALKPHFA